MNGKRIALLTVCIMSLAVLAIGCGDDNQNTVDNTGGVPRESNQPSGLVAIANPPVPDVPVPVGFHLDEGRSRSYAAAGTRYIEHVYKGNESKFAVARFYRRQMPLSRWQLVTDMFVQGKLLLDFQNETERCSITISDGGLFHKTDIEVELRTFGRIDPKKYNK